MLISDLFKVPKWATLIGPTIVGLGDGIGPVYRAGLRVLPICVARDDASRVLDKPPWVEVESIATRRCRKVCGDTAWPRYWPFETR